MSDHPLTLGMQQDQVTPGSDNMLNYPQQPPRPPRPQNTSGNNAFFEHYMGLAAEYRAAGLPDQYQAALEQAIKLRPKYNTTPQQMMVGGKLTNVLVSEDGSAKTMDGFEVKPDMVELDLGGKKQFVDKNTLTNGQSFAKTMTPGEAASNSLGWANNRQAGQRLNLEFGLGPDGQQNIDTTARAIANGQLPPPSGMALTNPRNQQILTRVMQINPNYDYTDITAKKKAASDFTSGPQGNQLRSFAVAGQHLAQLGDLVDAMGNGKINVVTRLANAYQSQTGTAAPTNFDAAKDVVSKEVVKAIVGAGGGVSEREELTKSMSNVRSPAQLKGVIDQYKTLMNAQQEALMQQRRAAGLSDSTLPNYNAPASIPSAGQWGIQKVN